METWRRKEGGCERREREGDETSEWEKSPLQVNIKARNEFLIYLRNEVKRIHEPQSTRLGPLEYDYGSKFEYLRDE